MESKRYIRGSIKPGDLDIIDEGMAVFEAHRDEITSEHLRKIAAALLTIDADLRRTEVLTVTDEEKRKIDKVLEVFRDYINGQSYFDIFYSRLFGYIRWDTEGIIKQVDNADYMVDCIINEIYMDVRNLDLEGNHTDIYMSAIEEAEFRKRTSPFIEKLDDSTHYYEIVEEYIAEMKEHAKRNLELLQGD